uniref:Cyclin-I2 isoform X2 n=1 Tax=Castor canadensis TaxID=51338 RepID=A0A8B7VJ80_CASCN|nr:cyclin-I2 isoform X2 [Castor canadensis]
MASGAQLPPGPSASATAISSPGDRDQRRLDQEALCFLLPLPLRKASPSAQPRSRLRGARQPRAASFPAPSARGPLVPRRGAARAPRASARVPTVAGAQTPQPSSPRPVPCDWRGLLDEGRLHGHLQLALGREARLWRGVPSQKAELRRSFQNIVLGLLKLDNIFHFAQSTINLALTIFSRLLASVKVKDRLLQCVTITSLRLAVKVNEEDESIPRVKDFIKHYGSDYSPNELLRMELAILDRLHWDLHMGTSLDFLTIFHALVVLNSPRVVELLPQRNPSLHVASLTRQLQHCMAGHQLLQFKGSTLALVIITLELERLMADCCTPISDLLKKAQMSPEQLGYCKELVKQHLRSL